MFPQFRDNFNMVYRTKADVFYIITRKVHVGRARISSYLFIQQQQWFCGKSWTNNLALMSSDGPKNLMSFDGPRKSWRVHKKTWGFGSIKRHEVLGGGKKGKTWVFWVHQKTWGFKMGRVHQKTWGFWVHQKTWDFVKGNTKMGPSKHLRFWVHQMKWGLKFCIKFAWVYQCTSGFIDCDNCSKSGHWGCGG